MKPHIHLSTATVLIKDVYACKLHISLQTLLDSSNPETGMQGIKKVKVVPKKLKSSQKSWSCARKVEVMPKKLKTCQKCWSRNKKRGSPPSKVKVKAKIWSCSKKVKLVKK